MVNGIEQGIPGGDAGGFHTYDDNLRLVVKGNVYSSFVDGDRRAQFVNVENIFSSGGFAIKANGNLLIDGIEVIAIP